MNRRGREDAGSEFERHDILAAAHGRSGRAAWTFKYLIVVILMLIVRSLGKALYHLSSSEARG